MTESIVFTMAPPWDAWTKTIQKYTKTLAQKWAPKATKLHMPFLAKTIAKSTFLGANNARQESTRSWDCPAILPTGNHPPLDSRYVKLECAILGFARDLSVDVLRVCVWVCVRVVVRLSVILLAQAGLLARLEQGTWYRCNCLVRCRNSKT